MSQSKSSKTDLSEEEQATWDALNKDYNSPPLFPWQTDMLNGLKKGELAVIAVGRSVGKSQLAMQQLGRALRKLGNTNV